MSAVIVACLLAMIAGWLFSFLGFALLWLAGLVIYAVLLMPAGSTFGQYVIALFALGAVAQVGFFASILTQVMLGRSGKAPEQAARRSLIGRILRQPPLTVAPQGIVPHGRSDVDRRNTP